MPPPHARNTCNFTCAATKTVSNICLGNEDVKHFAATQDRRKNTANKVNVNDWKVAPVEEAAPFLCLLDILWRNFRLIDLPGRLLQSVFEQEVMKNWDMNTFV